MTASRDEHGPTCDGCPFPVPPCGGNFRLPCAVVKAAALAPGPYHEAVGRVKACPSRRVVEDNPCGCLAVCERDRAVVNLGQCLECVGLSPAGVVARSP